MTPRSVASIVYTMAALAAACALFTSQPVSALPSSDWVQGHKSRARIWGGPVGAQGVRPLYAFVEIELADEWKTYWRNPGDAGGIPPAFDWSRSTNLAKATVQYPAPRRLVDKAGETLGYKHRVIFPVAIEPEDRAKPVRVDLVVNYGICRDICVPAEAELALELDPMDASALGADAANALALVPRETGAARTGDPLVESVTADIARNDPRVEISARFPGGVEGADALLEAPDGLYVPQPVAQAAPSGDVVVFTVDLAVSGVDIDALKGKTLIATIIGASGATEHRFKLE